MPIGHKQSPVAADKKPNSNLTKLIFWSKWKALRALPYVLKLHLYCFAAAGRRFFFYHWLRPPTLLLNIESALVAASLTIVIGCRCRMATDGKNPRLRKKCENA